MTAFLDEAQVELVLMDLLRDELGYEVAFGPNIAHDGEQPERSSYEEVLLIDRLRNALHRINPDVPDDGIEEAIRVVEQTGLPSLVENNRRFHRLLTDGVDVEYSGEDGSIVHDQVRLIDFDDPSGNDWLAVNQFTVIENNINRRPDVVIFINGLPIGLIEIKNPADKTATIHKAFKQIGTYKAQIPALLGFNEALVITDGIKARAGTITAGFDRFMPWRTINGKTLAPKDAPQMSVLIKGMFDKERLLDLIRFFIVFEDDGKEIAKKLAGYHQYHAVNKAVDCTTTATSPEGDQRIGVIWHTQGSGKSLTMVFYAAKLIQHPAMENPTIVVLTDRNDLDDQLHGTFSRCAQSLRQTPERAESREHLRTALTRASGGVIFTTIQKFFPEQQGESFPKLSERRNIVVIADEAHRSQYGLDARVRRSDGEIVYGFAKHLRDALPNASFVGFTGTPIEQADRSTPAVFGDYIDIYDIQRAVDDHATVPIFYEGRLAKLELKEEERPKIDPDFEEVTEGEEQAAKEKLKSKWARLESIVGAEKRVGLVARDLVDHFEQRNDVMEGKAMIVCMSRRICVDLYNAIVKLRPDWHNGDDAEGAIKVVMTGSASDAADWQSHIRNKPRREELAKRFKKPEDSLRIVLVRDMWLTGFDCPCLHTMYLDKPMRGHGLMQAIARVNRVFRDKPGGLAVDYLGIADQLKKALADYTESGGKGKAVFDQEEAVAVMLERYEIVCGIMHGFDFASVVDGPPGERIAGMAEAMEHVLTQEDGKKRFVQAVAELSKAFALAVPHEETIRVRENVGFFQAVKAGLTKTTPVGASTEEELDAAVRQIVSRAVASDQVVDIFSAVGLDKPNISILSEEFLAELRGIPQKNLAIEALHRLLHDQIKAKARKNLVQARSFREMLEESLRKYQNRLIEAAQVIEELIQLAKAMNAAQHRGEELNLSEDEIAFYDALEVNDSAVKVLGDELLQTIARELVEAVRRNVSIDWSVKESVRAKLRTIVKRILRKFGYPPDKQEQATLTVLAQAELLSASWT